MSEQIHKLIIIGSGPAGLTAAIYAARADLQPLVIDGSNPGGQLMNTTAVENWPGEKSIMGPKLMMNIRDHAKHFGTKFVDGNVTKVNFSQQPFTLWIDDKKELKAESVIIATGATPKRLGSPGEDKYWGKGVTTCAVCDGAFYKGKKVIVVGGGDTAMEDASFLKKFTNDITVVQILDELSASEAMKKRVLGDKDINVIYNSTITEIHGDENNVTHATITNKNTNESKKVEVDGIFVAIGLKPNTAPFKGILAMNDWGYLEVTDNTKTSIAGIFAAGDVHDYRYRQAITSSGAGCMAAMDAERYLSKKESK